MVLAPCWSCLTKVIGLHLEPITCVDIGKKEREREREREREKERERELHRSKTTCGNKVFIVTFHLLIGATPL